MRLLPKNHRVSDDIYERMRARWGDKGVVDLAGLIGYYSFVSVTLNVFEVPTLPDAKLLSETPDR
jgi:4-carboxymuconolactone decarboxylase